MASEPAPLPEERQCSICYEEIVLRGVLNSCRHIFCFDCIFKWSNTANTCPMCKLRFTGITKLDLTQPPPAAAGSGRKRKGEASTPKPEKVRVKKRDARFYEDPNDFTPTYRNELMRRLHEPPSPFVPFWSRPGLLLRDLLFAHHRSQTVPRHSFSDDDDDLLAPPSPPSAHVFPSRFPEPSSPQWIYRPPSRPLSQPRPSTQPRPAAADPPICIDLTEEEPEISRAKPEVIEVVDLTDDSPVVEIVDVDTKPAPPIAPAATLPRSRIPHMREEGSYPRRLQINITGGSPQIGIFNVLPACPTPGNDRQSDVSIDSLFWD